MTYYTCDECEWAGPFEDSRSHYEESGHDAFSRRDKTEAVATERVVEKHYIQWQQPWYCNHSFTWMGTIAPSHCPKCGMQLHSWQPNIYSNGSYTVTSGGAVPYSKTISATTASGSVAGTNYTLTWDNPDGMAGSSAKL